MKALAALCLALGLSGCVAVPILPPARAHVVVPAPTLVVRPVAPAYYGYRPRHWQSHY
jgi:hypothetical protein